MKGNHAKKKSEDLTPKGLAREANSILTKHLKRLGNKVSDRLNDSGEAMTQFEALAELVWKKALGYSEIIVLDNGEKVETIHKPDRSFIGIIFDRTEGKVAPVVTGEKQKMSAVNRVGEQAKARLNKLVGENSES